MKGKRSWAVEFMEVSLRIYIYYMPYLLFMLAARNSKGATSSQDALSTDVWVLAP